MYEERSVELLLDTRLSFRDNFLLFPDDRIKTFADKEIMARKGRYVLNKETPIVNFSLKSFTRLYVY